LHDLATTLRARGVVTQTDVIESEKPVGRGLLDVARRSAVDVVVMATRDQNARGDLSLGTVAAEVLEHCPVPVLLVPSSAGMEPTMQARPSDRTANPAAVQP
jgi:nucleotide-binding universal stress UspA family protein